MKVTNNQSHQNVKFVDGDDPFMEGYSTATDSTRMDQDADPVPLSEFFSRPIKIQEIAWGSVTGTVQFNPWNLFFTNPRVSNRLTNYNLIRATLKVKFVVNGNAFYFGRMMCGYIPFLDSDSMTTYSSAGDTVGLSQLPHIFVNPTTSTGGIITCPFFYNKNYALIPTSNYNDLGTICCKVINSLLHANDPAYTPITITVYAWAEDVQLSVLTSVDTDTLIPQSGEIEQANATGTVSGPATSIARIANAMSRIPGISPYAKATELAASTISSIASRFGYCRPSVTKAPDLVRVLPTGSFALTNTPDLSQKLTVDHKQELSIDPRIAGIEEDDMLSIVNIAKRESYWTTFNWPVIGPSGDLLWNGRVTPSVWYAGFQGAFNFPATAMAALPFKYWTGTLNYRFQVVASGFHKGRLGVVWDPNFIGSTGFPELNVLHSEIIDISETQDFTVSISNGQPFTLIPNTRPGITSVTEISSLTRYSSYESFSNGVIGVYIVNSLTIPNTDVAGNIQVNVYISAGDDFKVYVPDDYFQNFVPTTPTGLVFPLVAPQDEEPVLEVLEEQSGNLIGSNDPTDDMPESIPSHDLFNTSSSDYTSLVYAGEAIPSFRALLKRYAHWTSLAPYVAVGAITAINANYKFAFYPYQRGRYTNAPDLAVGAIPYAFANTLLMHWVSYAFAGFRGSIRYKVVPRLGSPQLFGSTHISVQRYSNDDGNEYAVASRFTPGQYTSSSRAAQTSVKQGPLTAMSTFAPQGATGMAWVNQGNSDTLEFEVPFYSRYRFCGTRHLGWTKTDTWDAGGYYLFFRGALTNFQLYDIYSATGEDFQTYFFIGLPRMYYEPTPPASV